MNNVRPNAAIVLLSLSLFYLSAAKAQSLGKAQLADCYARWDNSHIVVGNSQIERSWLISGDALTPTSFRDLTTQTEWLSQKKTPVAQSAAFTVIALTGNRSPVEAAALTLHVKTSGTLTYEFKIFPQIPAVLVQKISPPNSSQSKDDLLESLSLTPLHLLIKGVTLRDQTDRHNTLVSEQDYLLHPSDGALELSGNLFIAENTARQSGLVFLKLAPLPDARPVKPKFDASFHVAESTVDCRFVGSGLDNEGGVGYAFADIVYSGGETGRIKALQDFQRQFRVYDPSRDARFITNTWGDRSQDMRINSKFVAEEIAADARLGADVLELDDGWQQGMSANSKRGKGAWGDFWESDSHFWNPSPARFPDGLLPVVAAAKEQGLSLGLWFGSDSVNDTANWQRDANRLLTLYRETGVPYFKVDGVNVITKTAERHLNSFFDELLNKSEGKITIDLDVTAQSRPGYFGRMDAGPVFVENRYTDKHSYWPHQTLRNLWMLSKYVDPRRLRMEFLNSQRNRKLYESDPLAPSIYSPAYLFATTMMSNPLGWFEASNLPPDYISEVSKIAATWKQHRDQLFNGNIFPIGNPPDGISWTGFVSYSFETRKLHLLAFRGINSPPDWSIDLTRFPTSAKAAKFLAGDGSAKIENGRVHLSVNRSPGFVWVEI